MPLPIQITNLEVKASVATNRSDNIKAFGELLIYSDHQVEPLLKIKGITIRLMPFGLTVKFPAYKAGAKHLTSFFINNASLFTDVKNMFLQEYSDLTGEPIPDNKDQEYVNPDDIPL